MISAKIADKERTTIIDRKPRFLIHKFVLQNSRAIFYAKVGLRRHFGVVVELAYA